MRDIKFRVWDTYLKMMFNWEEVKKSGYELESVFELVSVKVMQFTGVKDRNGVEVYEGNIVDHENLGLCRVVYDVTEFLLLTISNGQRCCLRGQYNAVIGNIHENPELII